MNPPAALCNLCGHRDFLVQEDSAPPFRVLKCRHCGLVFVHPIPDPGDLVGHYDENYYKVWITEQQDKRARMWRNRLHRIEKRIPKGHLLDVGCGDGSFLALAQESGWTISGIEYSTHASEFVSARLGIQIHCGELTKADYPEKTFDVVTLWHVLEHVTDPMAYLSKIFRILKPSGWLVLAVPNVNAVVMQLAYRILKGRKMQLFSPKDREVHLYHFSVETLRAYIEKTGFKYIRLSPDTGIVDPGKRFINCTAILLYRLTGRTYFNAIEAWAVKS